MITGACSSNKTSKSGVCDVDCSTANMKGYSFDNADGVYIKTTMKQSYEMIKDKQTAVFFYGFSKCPWCKAMVQELNDAAKKLDMKVYYVNVRPNGKDIRVDTNKWYVKLQEVYSSFLDADKRIYVPNVFVVKKGKVLANHEGTLDKYSDEQKKMSKADKKELKQIYIDLIKKIK